MDMSFPDPFVNFIQNPDSKQLCFILHCDILKKYEDGSQFMKHVRRVDAGDTVTATYASIASELNGFRNRLNIKMRGAFAMRSKIMAIAVMLLVMFFLVPSAYAETSGPCGDNLTWTLTDDGTLTISGTGKMTDYDEPSVYAASPFRVTMIVVPE